MDTSLFTCTVYLADQLTCAASCGPIFCTSWPVSSPPRFSTSSAVCCAPMPLTTPAVGPGRMVATSLAVGVGRTACTMEAVVGGRIPCAASWPAPASETWVSSHNRAAILSWSAVAIWCTAQDTSGTQRGIVASVEKLLLADCLQATPLAYR